MLNVPHTPMLQSARAVASLPEQPAQAGCAAVPFDAGKFLQVATAKPHNKRLDLFFCV